VRRETVDTFSVNLWGAIGQIIVHRLCWNSIKKRFGKKMLKVFKVLADKGFGEYLERYKGVMKG
jgi:hypothetical protein